MILRKSTTVTLISSLRLRTICYIFLFGVSADLYCSALASSAPIPKPSAETEPQHIVNLPQPIMDAREYCSKKFLSGNSDPQPSTTTATEPQPQHIVNLRVYTQSLRGEMYESIPQLASGQIIDYLYHFLFELVAKDCYAGAAFNKDYGFSHLERNKAPVDCVVKLLLGEGEWSKDEIQSGKIKPKIADVGCGLGLSACMLIVRTIQGFKRQGWRPHTPIQLTLYDKVSEHVDALRSLSSLINDTNKEYFTVTVVEHDVTQPFMDDATNHRVFALSLMHYIPDVKWGISLRNIAGIMAKDARLLLTADAYKQSEASKSPTSPFTSIPLLFTINLGSEYGRFCELKNPENIPYLKQEIDSYAPTTTYGLEQIDINNLRTLLNSNSSSLSKRDYTVDEVIKQIEAGQIGIYVGPYGFGSPLLLQRAIEETTGNMFTTDGKNIYTEDVTYVVGLMLKKSTSEMS